MDFQSKVVKNIIKQNLILIEQDNKFNQDIQNTIHKKLKIKNGILKKVESKTSRLIESPGK